ncbi:hypothetical protein chiPu_0003778 [Chiloscyllium punctatum]|uniref:Uncharacterized protein n=1 Tax=Chiloscyllium punctatum TaxID=137246 RepID=A0A401S4R2_CHIPU|nr:hypothetical protein [Chiloscyllium punctatum]
MIPKDTLPFPDRSRNLFPLPAPDLQRHVPIAGPGARALGSTRLPWGGAVNQVTSRCFRWVALWCRSSQCARARPGWLRLCWTGLHRTGGWGGPSREERDRSLAGFLQLGCTSGLAVASRRARSVARDERRRLRTDDKTPSSFGGARKTGDEQRTGADEPSL